MYTSEQLILISNTFWIEQQTKNIRKRKHVIILLYKY